MDGRIWRRVCSGLGVLVLAASGGAGVALYLREPTLELRPLAGRPAAPDTDQHVLVRVPQGTPRVGIDLTGLDLSALTAYEGRVRSVERTAAGRIVALLTDGSTVDVTGDGKAAAARTPLTTRTLPQPLAALATMPQVREISPVDSLTWRITGDLTPPAVASLTGLPTVADERLFLDADDTYRHLLWGLDNRGGGSFGGVTGTADADVDGVEAGARATGAGVVVAIVDSGIQPDHPDLPKLWTNPDEVCGNGTDDDRNGYVDDCAGWDFVHGDNTPYDTADDNDHGTHVAGTIAAIPHNGRGVAGLAPGVSLMSLKITSNGSIWLSHAAEAVRYAADNGARVINASFGTNPGAGRQSAAVLEDAIAYARSQGVLVVAAAGNDGVNIDSSPVWPASLPYDNVVTVGASTAADGVASFSNTGANAVDLFAPGHYIASTVDRSTYAAMQGTSMATPHVTAAAALVLSREPNLSPAAVRARLMSTGDPLAAYAGKSVSGARLNAERAPGADGLRVEAGALNGFLPGEEHTATLTVQAPTALFPTGSTVSVRASLYSLVNGAVYAVVDHPVTINGAAVGTDASARVALTDADGVQPGGSTLTGGGLRVAFGTVLPAGDYALAVEAVATGSPDHGYGAPAALFFTVRAGEVPGAPGGSGPDGPQGGGETPADPAPVPGDGITPGIPGSGPVEGGAGPGGSSPGGTVPGSVPGGTGPGGSVPGGTVPDGTVPGGTVPGSAPGGTVPGSTPGGTVPTGSTPGGTTPGGSPGAGNTPGGTPNTPGGTAPGGTTPSTGTAPGSAPGTGTAPGGNTPANGTTPGGTPNTGTTPGGTAPGGAPNTGTAPGWRGARHRHGAG
jgi:serine protease